jgi:hypothetical protein
MAATQMDNLSGDVEALKGSFETALISSGSGANKVMREIVQTATSALNVFNELPGPVKQTASGLAAVGGVAAVLGGAAMIGVGQVAKLKRSLEDLGVSAERSQSAVRALGTGMKILGIAGAAFAAVGVVDQLMQLSVSAPKLGEVSEELMKLADGMDAAAAGGIDLEDLGDKIDDIFGRDFMSSTSFGAKYKTFFSPGLRQAKSDIEALDQTLAAMVGRGDAVKAAAAYQILQKAALEGGASQGEVNRAFNDYQDALAGARAEAGNTGGAMDGLTGKIDQQRQASLEAGKALRKQAEDLRALFDPLFAAQTALSRNADAQRDLNKARREHGAKSAEYKAALEAAREAAVNAAGAVQTLRAGLMDQSVTLQDATGRIDGFVKAGLISAAQGRAWKADLAKLAGQVRDLGKDLDTVGSKHPKPSVAVKGLQSAEAVAQRIENHLKYIDGYHAEATVKITYGTVGHRQGDPGIYGPPLTPASGGYITGPGTSTSDSIPAMLSNGEYVINAAQTARFRPVLEAINAGRLSAFNGSTSAMAAGGARTTIGHQGDRTATIIYHEAAPVRKPDLYRDLAQAEFLLGV